MSQPFFLRPALRRAGATVAATALAASTVLTVVPAHAATVPPPASALEVDWPGSPADPAFGLGYGGYGRNAGLGPYGGYASPYDQVPVTAGLDATDATTAQSRGVVMVSTVVEFGSGEGAGTGMVIDGDEGVVVTNHHVVEGSTEVTVTVATTGETYDAEVLGTDATHDVAVLLLVDAPSMPEVTTNTATLDVGDAVTAVGDAGGDGGTLTAAPGTVTDPHEPVTVSNDDGTETTIRNLIEVDADIISGDSGGALLDGDGDVVGMNVAASSGRSDIVGYVIPIRRVLRIADDILSGEESSTVSVGYDAFLGVQLASGTGAATIAAVLEGGAADEAGLRAGDIVTAVAGTATPTIAALRRAVASHDAGDEVRVAWTDSLGEAHSADLTLGRAPVA